VASNSAPCDCHYHPSIISITPNARPPPHCHTPQLDHTCHLGDAPAPAHPDGTVSTQLRTIVAIGLGLEALLGIYIPIMLRSVAGYEWWLSLLNCFSGGVFVAAGGWGPLHVGGCSGAWCAGSMPSLLPL